MSEDTPIDAEVVDETTGEVQETLPAVQMRGEVLRPEDVRISTAEGVAFATELSEVVTQQKWTSNISGKRYLNVEAWEFIGGRFGFSNSTEIEFVNPAGNMPCVLSHCTITDRRTGEVVAKASQICEIDGRYKEIHAAMGMAQTRSISRAYQQQFRWIAQLAGYEGTPGEEMEGLSGRTPPSAGKPPPAPVQAADAPSEDPPWFDETLGGREFKGKSWRFMCEGSRGRRENYLHWVIDTSQHSDEAKERASVCLSICQKRYEEATAAANPGQCPECHYDMPEHAEGCPQGAADAAMEVPFS